MQFYITYCTVQPELRRKPNSVSGHEEPGAGDTYWGGLGSATRTDIKSPEPETNAGRAPQHGLISGLEQLQPHHTLTVLYVCTYNISLMSS